MTFTLEITISITAISILVVEMVRKYLMKSPLRTTRRINYRSTLFSRASWFAFDNITISGDSVALAIANCHQLVTLRRVNVPSLLLIHSTVVPGSQPVE